MAAQNAGLLELFLWNGQGINEKINTINTLLKQTETIKIICLTETMGKNNHVFEGAFENFEVIQKAVVKLAESGQTNFPGGLLFGYKKDLDKTFTFSKIPNQSDSILWVKAEPKSPAENVQMIFAVVYNPPTKSTTKDEILSIMEREYKDLAEEYKDAKFYIMGDFNAYTHDKSDCPEWCRFKEREYHTEDTTNFQQKTENGERLIDFCKRTGFRIANGRFGDESKTVTTDAHVFDYVLVRQKNWNYIESLKVGEKHGSDHKALAVTLKTTLPVLPFPNSLVQYITLNTPREQDDFKIKWVTGGPDRETSDRHEEGYEHLTHANHDGHTHISNIYINRNDFSDYKVRAVPQLQQESARCMMHGFSLANKDAPLVVTDIVCLYTKYCSSIGNTLAMIEWDLRKAYTHSYQNYPKSKFTFFGNFFTNAVGTLTNDSIKQTVSEVLVDVPGTHWTDDYQLQIGEQDGRYTYQVKCKFTLIQLFYGYPPLPQPLGLNLEYPPQTMQNKH